MHVGMQVGMYAQGEHWRLSLLPNTKTHYFSTCYRQEVEAFRALKHHSLTPSLFGTATLRLRPSYPSLHKKHTVSVGHGNLHSYTSHVGTGVSCYTRSLKARTSALPAHTNLTSLPLSKPRRQSHLPSASSFSKTRICSNTKSGILDMFRRGEERRETPTEAIRRSCF